MSALLSIVSAVSATTAASLVSAIWQGALLAACVALCLRLLPTLSPSARSVIWTSVFLLLVLLHVFPLLGMEKSNGQVFDASALHLNPLWSVVIAAVWLALILWRGIQLLSSAIHLHALASRATPVHPNAALQALLRTGEGKRHRSAELCTSAEVERPSVFGFFRPRILIPIALLDKLSDQELQQVVLHEMEHLRRNDDWTNLLQKIGLVFFPLNPALLWVERRLCMERELACDDRVLRSSCGRKAYATCLTRLAEYSMLRRSLSLALGAWERRSELVRRVYRILRQPDQPMSGMRAGIVIGALIASLAGGAIILSRSPQLISFAPVTNPASFAAVAKPTAFALRSHSTAVQISAKLDSEGGGGFNPRTRPAEMMRALAPAEYIPATSRESTASATLVKAVMPQRLNQSSFSSGQLSPAALNSAHRGVAHPATSAVKRVTRRNQAPQNQRQWLVLTEWDGITPPQRLVIAVSQDHRSYAAIATANGWLIVQI